MDKIVITGHKGYIGSRLLKKFPDAMVLEGNILSATLPDADVVFHLAAYASVPESWNRPVDYMENLRTTVRLTHAYPNAKIILASSCVNENPESSPYAFSKRVAADYLKLYHKNWVNLIFPNIFGESPRSVVDIFKRAKELKINGDGLQVRDYVHVDDIVEALCKAQNWPPGEYSLGSGIGTTVLDIAKATGKPYSHVEGVREQREAVIPNTTPIVSIAGSSLSAKHDWQPTINVLEYAQN